MTIDDTAPTSDRYNLAICEILPPSTADSTAPTVSMTAPSNGVGVSGAAVPVSATASDNVGVSSVQFTLDGANLGAALTTAPYTIGWDSTRSTNGTHSLQRHRKGCGGEHGRGHAGVGHRRQCRSHASERVDLVPLERRDRDRDRRDRLGGRV